MIFSLDNIHEDNSTKHHQQPLNSTLASTISWPWLRYVVNFSRQKIEKKIV